MEKELFRLVRALEKNRAKLENGVKLENASLNEFVENDCRSEVALIERRLKTLGLNPDLPNLIERAFYVEHGISGVNKMLYAMKSSRADELVPDYMYDYGITISLSASGLRTIANKIAKKENDALPYMAARLTRLYDIEKWEVLREYKVREKWNLIDALMARGIDPYSNPIRNALVHNSASAVRRLLPMLEADKLEERAEAIKELGAIGIIESDPRVLRYLLDPNETEPVLSSRDLYLIASNPDWKEIARDTFWYNQADGTPERTKFGLRLEHTMVMAQNPDWKEIALSRTLERYSKLDT